MTALAGRLPVMLGQFLKIGDHKVRSRFGQEPDGRPFDLWGRTDLERSLAKTVDSENDPAAGPETPESGP